MKYNYKYLGNKDNVYYCTIITNNIVRDDVNNNASSLIYKHFAKMGWVKDLSWRIVIFEFYTYTDYIQVKVVHNEKSTYRMRGVDELDEYEDILNEYLKQNKCVGEIICHVASDEDAVSGVETNKDGGNLDEEIKIKNKGVYVDGGIVVGVGM